MNPAAFEQARSAVVGLGRERAGIGTLGEKTLHAVLKRYLEPRPEYQEIPVGPFVADIANGKGITEIQTGSFDRLRDKLDYFLPLGPVTIVYPVALQKWIVWVDRDGSATPRRKSPKPGAPCEIFPQPYKIKSRLSHPNLRLQILLLELDEYRIRDGWSGDGKRGASRYDRIPNAIVGEIRMERGADYLQLIPPALAEPFTVKEFGKSAGISAAAASRALNVLFSVGAVLRDGKRGGAFLYRRGQKPPPLELLSLNNK